MLGDMWHTICYKRTLKKRNISAAAEHFKKMTLLSMSHDHVNISKLRGYVVSCWHAGACATKGLLVGPCAASWCQVLVVMTVDVVHTRLVLTNDIATACEHSCRACRGCNAQCPRLNLAGRLVRCGECPRLSFRHRSISKDSVHTPCESTVTLQSSRASNVSLSNKIAEQRQLSASCSKINSVGHSAKRGQEEQLCVCGSTRCTPC